MSHNFFRDSKCIGSWLHRYSITEEYPEGVLEVCEICKIKRFFKIIDDKVNGQNYMDSHFRNALPPSHPFYYHEFEYNPFDNGIISPYV